MSEVIEKLSKLNPEHENLQTSPPSDDISETIPHSRQVTALNAGECKGKTKPSVSNRHVDSFGIPLDGCYNSPQSSDGEEEQDEVAGLDSSLNLSLISADIVVEWETASCLTAAAGDDDTEIDAIYAKIRKNNSSTVSLTY